MPTGSRIAPSPLSMDRLARVSEGSQSMERLETGGGVAAYHDMADGWKLHSETWAPPLVTPAAVLLFSHGWLESTRSLGVRRLAHACLSRGFVLVAFDTHGHGLSLEKAGVKMPEKRRGCIENLEVCGMHLAEMASVIVKEHRLPLVVMAHSLAASALVFSTRKVVEAAKAAGGQMVGTVYLAPPPAGLAPPCFPDCCFASFLPALCGCCVCAAPKDVTPGLNPDLVLGENRNATRMYASNRIPIICLGPYGSDGTRARSDPDRMAAELRELRDAGVPGRIFAGSKDTTAVSAARLANFAKGPRTLSTERIDGATRDMLSTDNVNRIFVYIEARFGYRTPHATPVRRKA